VTEFFILVMVFKDFVLEVKKKVIHHHRPLLLNQ